MNDLSIEAIREQLGTIQGLIESGINGYEVLVIGEFQSLHPKVVELLAVVEDLQGAKVYAEALDEKYDWCIEAVRGMARQLELPDATLPVTAGEVVAYLDNIADGIEKVKPGATTDQL